MFSLMGNCFSCIKQRREPKREVTLAILGLDSAGKTTTTKALLGDTLETAPTIGFNKEDLTFENYHIVLYDLGGGKKIRDIWKNYLSEVYGVIYVVDSSNRERISEVRDNLKVLLGHEQVQEKPLLVLANKQDIPHGMDDVEICEKLHLEDVVNSNKCPCKMETCSAIKGTGKRMDANIKHGMTWMCSVLNKSYDKLHLRVQEDMEVAEKKRQVENAARKERVRKAREEREKKEEAERKKLGIEKEDEQDEEDDLIGGPWKRLDADEIKKKEEKYEQEKKKQKERQRRLKELEEVEHTTQTRTTNDLEDEEDDMFRAPRSSRSLQSYGLSNGAALRSGRGRHSHRSDEEQEDSDGFIPPVSRSNHKNLPPLQSPLGAKFIENGDVAKQRKNKKSKPKSSRSDEAQNFEASNYSHLSVSRIQVESRNGLDRNFANENNNVDSTRHSYDSKNNYYMENGLTEISSARQKKGKKKLLSGGGNEDEEGFDTLRLSQHLEDDVEERTANRPPLQKPGRVLLRKVEGADYREEETQRAGTPVKKLKKKKNIFRKNNIAPSDDEYELSDVQTSPKRELPWVRSSPSPRKMLDDVDNHTNKWGLAEDLGTADDRGFSRRHGPNAESEDDLIL